MSHEVRLVSIRIESLIVGIIPVHTEKLHLGQHVHSGDAAKRRQCFRGSSISLILPREQVGDIPIPPLPPVLPAHNVLPSARRPRMGWSGDNLCEVGYRLLLLPVHPVGNGHHE
jgi:hypothetical protein